MENQFSRTELIYGKAAMKKLANARIAVFGIGGVGGHTVEALVRSGIGAIDIIDNDKVNKYRLQLVSKVKEVLFVGLQLLGINAPDVM